MYSLKPNPVSSEASLRRRVSRLLKTTKKKSGKQPQQSLELESTLRVEHTIDYPSKNITKFLDFLTDALPEGDVYLFGGLLRDLALLGSKGFNSDIDIVVEGDWRRCGEYLEHLGAKKNKFGGYRLSVDGWPIDVWSAPGTWAIRQGLVEYKGIASLTETTVLNWDAILMNWRTGAFIFRRNYFEDLGSRVLDVVLKENPDPLGMAVRVFRHLCLKDAQKITSSAAEYLADCTKAYSFAEISKREKRSYGNNLIASNVYQFFQQVGKAEGHDLESRYSIARDIMEKELGFT
jgi:predicted nucleotidyltransferase